MELKLLKILEMIFTSIEIRSGDKSFPFVLTGTTGGGVAIHSGGDTIEEAYIQLLSNAVEKMVTPQP